jgi:hypothetical protein
LSRDERTASGYDLALVSTDLDASPAALVTRHAAQWGIELRRTMIAACFSPSRPGQPGPEQIRAVLAALRAAGNTTASAARALVVLSGDG